MYICTAYACIWTPFLPAPQGALILLTKRCNHIGSTIGWMGSTATLHLDITMKELVEIAIVAYRAGRYRDAIELLLQVTDGQPDNWLARLYLGMCYEKSARATDAHRLFKRLIEECPDQHIRQKASNCLPLIEAEMRQRFKKQKSASASLSADDAEDMVWIANDK